MPHVGAVRSECSVIPLPTVAHGDEQTPGKAGERVGTSGPSRRPRHSASERRHTEATEAADSGVSPSHERRKSQNLIQRGPA